MEITDPTLVFLLITLGLVGIGVETLTPGGFIPGLIGIAALVFGVIGAIDIGVAPTTAFFSVPNMMPGDDYTKAVTVNNLGSSELRWSVDSTATTGTAGPRARTETQPRPATPAPSAPAPPRAPPGGRQPREPRALSPLRAHARGARLPRRLARGRGRR